MTFFRKRNETWNSNGKFFASTYENFFLLYLCRDQNETDCYSVSVRQIMVFGIDKQPSNVTSFSDTFLPSTYNIELKEWNVTRIYGKRERKQEENLL
jgi:hypothetical protein